MGDLRSSNIPNDISPSDAQLRLNAVILAREHLIGQIVETPAFLGLCEAIYEFLKPRPREA